MPVPRPPFQRARGSGPEKHRGTRCGGDPIDDSVNRAVLHRVCPLGGFTGKAHSAMHGELGGRGERKI
ncbi:hypothetical protein ACIO8G_00535 [Streptomyces sp. NPDC087219]|uniref:hypothetical protein n=1 Tax=unclassified Streptomyces TaxID=2593676 RepID=UPI0037FC8F9C